jgi:SPX domain protein involved in polyphosphate accumulation
MESRKVKHFRRFEFKYHIPERLVDEMVAYLLKHNMVWDPYSADMLEQQYKVTSLYFDSPTLAAYYDKIFGIEARAKLRLRVYDTKLTRDQKVFFEIKKRNDSVVSKDRVALS